MFGFLTERALKKKEACQLYDKAVGHARQPVFYREYGVPDSVDGRFEMISLHTALLIRSLQKADKEKIAQALFDVMFINMDKSLREMGVGDLGVPKHMKRMMKGFKGRAMHYIDAIDQENDDDLKDAVKRNIYGTLDEIDDTNVNAIAGYIRQSAKALDGFTGETLTDFMFPAIAEQNEEELKRA